MIMEAFCNMSLGIWPNRELSKACVSLRLSTLTPCRLMVVWYMLYGDIDIHIYI